MLRQFSLCAWVVCCELAGLRAECCLLLSVNSPRLFCSANCNESCRFMHVSASVALKSWLADHLCHGRPRGANLHS
jgi:hypothetical protein